MSTLELEAETNLNVFFPLPYRVLLLFGLGIFAWATNLHGLHLLGVNAVAALELHTEGLSPRTPSFSSRLNGHFGYTSPSVVYIPTYILAFAYGAFCLSSWTLYRMCTRSERLFVDAFGYLPFITALTIFAFIFCPVDVLFKRERDKFL